MILALVLVLQVSGGVDGQSAEVRVEDGVVHVRARQSCDVELADPDRERLAAALRKIKPGHWKPKYLDAGCRDCRITRLRVGDRSVTWDTASEAHVPQDAVGVARAMEPLLSCQ